MYQYSATVIRWVDGDTVDLRVDLGFKMWAETRFRLLGIDTPERGQANWAEARKFAESLAPAGHAVKIATKRDGDKYGRWLVEITLDDGSTVNGQLLASGLAVPYEGTKA